MLMLTEYLEEKKILLDLEGGDLEHVLGQLLGVSSEKNHKKVIDFLLKRESRMSTALGHGVMLPRVIIDNKEKTESIIAISERGIEVKSFDSLPVRIIMLHLFSRNEDYASILAQSLRFLNDESIRTTLLTSRSPREVISIIKKWEEE